MSKRDGVCSGMMGAEDSLDFFKEEDAELDSRVCLESGLTEQLSLKDDANREKMELINSVLFGAAPEREERQTESLNMYDQRPQGRDTERTLDVCLHPVEKSGAHVRISMQEVKRYYRFSRCCHWLLCGT